MKRPYPILLCGLTLIGGYLAGATFGVWPVGNQLRADAYSRSRSDKIYNELQSEENILVQGGSLLAKVAALTTPSVVHIQSERTNGRGLHTEETGSGVMMQGANSTETFVITNRHVVASPLDGSMPPMEEISIHLHDGRVLHPEQILSDKDSDVAVMKITAADLQAARWGNSDNVKIGHMVLRDY
jgi:serine protease Do